MALHDKFKKLIESVEPISWPQKCIAISDIHASNGGDNDPILIGGKEAQIIALLEGRLSDGYSILMSEVFDIWRGGDVFSISAKHPALTHTLLRANRQGRLFRAIGNHEIDEQDKLLLKEAFIFEGYSRKMFFDHGHFGDWPNDDGWKVGRFVTRAVMELGIDPETSPHPSNLDRHSYVRALRAELAKDNPTWTFLYGHTHYQEQAEENLFNSSCGHDGEYIEMIEGKFEFKKI